jgi:hypothetical protein
MGFTNLFRKKQPDPVTYDHTLQAALAAARRGQHEVAKELFTRVADGVPEEGTACHMLGVEYFRSDVPEAAVWFERSLSRAYMEPELRLASLGFLAECYIQMGRKNDARACIDRLRPDMPTVAAHLASKL